MSATWQIENTYYKISVDNSANNELFNIASCENYMAYWDFLNQLATLYIYNIPNDFTQISSYEKILPAGENPELLLDINKNGVCLYLINDKIGLYNTNRENVSLTTDYDFSFTRLAIGSKYGYIKNKTSDGSYVIQYFDISDSLANNEISMNILTTTYDSIDIELDEYSVLSIYDDDFVIGCPTSASDYGKLYIYNNITYNETKEYTEAQTFGGYQISTGHHKIIVRSLISLLGDPTKDIPIYIYTKSGNNYVKTYQSKIDNLSQVFINNTPNNTSYYITNTYDVSNNDRRIKVYNANHESVTVFFDGNETNNTFPIPIENNNIERKDITVNDSFLFVRMPDYIHVFAFGEIMVFPNISTGIVPIDDGLEIIYSKKPITSYEFDSTSALVLDFSSNFHFNPHKLYLSLSYIAQIGSTMYDSLTITKYDHLTSSTESLEIYDTMSHLQHKYIDSDNTFVSYYTKEYYLHQSLVGSSYNKFELSFNNVANIDEIEFIIFSQGNIEQTATPESEIYPEFIEPTFSCVHTVNLGTTQIVPENGNIIVTERPYVRAMATNPAYCSEETRSVLSHIEKIKAAHNLAVKKGSNSFKQSKKKQNTKILTSQTSKRLTNTLSLVAAEDKANLRELGGDQMTNNYSLGKSNIDKNNLKQTYRKFRKPAQTPTTTSSPDINYLLTFPLNRLSSLRNNIVKTKEIPPFPSSLMNINTLPKTVRNTGGSSLLEDRLSSFNIIPYIEEVNPETFIEEKPFATFSVYVTFLEGGFKLIINNFGNGFFYDNKVYRLDLSHYTNLGHTIKFNKTDSLVLSDEFSVIRGGVPGTIGSFIQITTTNIASDMLYIYTELGGIDSGSFYNPISILPDTELPVDYTTVAVTVEIMNNSGLKFVFDNTDANILYSNRQFKFDVSNPTNAGYYLKFSKESDTRVSYNTISIGTPGTENACVYFYSPNAIDVNSVYVYDEVKGYVVGDLYNPIKITATPMYRTLNKQREFDGITFALNEEKTLALITSNVNWKHINIEDNTSLSPTIYADTSRTLRNIYVDNSDTLVSFLDNSDNNVYFVKKYSNSNLELIAECSSNSEYFGDSIVKFNNNYIISSYGDNSVHVFDTSLIFIQTITHQEGGQFGKILESNNDFLFITAPLYKNYKGSVYCYDKELSNVQTFIETNTIQFGLNISVNSLNMLIISARNHIYEYVYDGSSFYFLDDLYPPETTQYDIPGTSMNENFGNQVVIDSTGRYLYVTNNFLNFKSGVVYVYENIFNKRTQIQKITTDPLINNNLFGNKIEINDDYLVILSNDKVVVYCETYDILTDPPVAYDLTFDTSQNVHIEFDLSADDVDVSYIITSVPQHGILYQNNNVILMNDDDSRTLSNTSLLFYPGFDFYGDVSFTYMVRKDQVNSDSSNAIVSITVAEYSVTNVVYIGDSGGGSSNITLEPGANPNPSNDSVGYINIERPPTEISFNVPLINEGEIENYFQNSFVKTSEPYDYFDHIAFKVEPGAKITKFTLQEFKVGGFGVYNASFAILLQKDDSGLDISDPSYNGYTFTTNTINTIIEKDLDVYSIANTFHNLDIDVNDYDVAPGNYNMLLHIKNAQGYQNIDYKFKIVTALGLPNEIRRSLGKILYRPTAQGSTGNIDVIQIWASASENVPLPSIDITVTKSITIFYNLLDKYVLNYTENNTIKSLVDCIQLYRDTSFDSIQDIFITPSFEFINDNAFSLYLSHIENSADSAKPFGDKNPIYFSEDTKGVEISQEEYNILMNYINSLRRTIKGISNGIKHWKQTNDLMETIDTYKISYDILNDTAKLYQHIRDKNPNNVPGLSTQLSLLETPELKDHVEQYYLRYGWPTDFVFDEILMAQIISESNPI